MKEKEKDEPIRDRKGTTRCTSEGDDCDLPLKRSLFGGKIMGRKIFPYGNLLSRKSFSKCFFFFSTPSSL